MLLWSMGRKAQLVTIGHHGQLRVSHLTSPHLSPWAWGGSLGCRHPNHLHSEQGVRKLGLAQNHRCGAKLEAAPTSMRAADHPSLPPQSSWVRGDGRRLKNPLCCSCHFPQIFLQLPTAGEQGPPEPNVGFMTIASLGGFLLHKRVLPRWSFFL